MAEPDQRVVVEVAWATTDRQRLVDVSVPRGASVEEVLQQSGLIAEYPEIAKAAVGIWGRVVERDARVKNGDRVEIYRPLEMEPREARRKLAESGRTMSQGSGD